MNSKIVSIFGGLILASVLAACGAAEKASVQSHAGKDVQFENKENIPWEQERRENEKNNDPKTTENDRLKPYSEQEIEYTRVWLQEVGHDDVEKIYVSNIKGGEPVNPYDDDSVDYQEDVTYLQGEVMAQGGVFYHSNGDGTINTYDSPTHMPAPNQLDESMEEWTRDIAENPETKSVDPGDDDDVADFLEKVTFE